jgi:hypothetical protein
VPRDEETSSRFLAGRGVGIAGCEGNVDDDRAVEHDGSDLSDQCSVFTQVV